MTDTEPSEPIAELTDSPANDIKDEPTTTEPDPLLEELQNITEALEDQKKDETTILYPSYIPRYNPYITETGEVVSVTPINTGITGGGIGGGFGNGAGVEEPTDMGGGEKRMAMPEDTSKKKIIWLVLIALAVYIAYRYWKK